MSYVVRAVPESKLFPNPVNIELYPIQLDPEYVQLMHCESKEHLAAHLNSFVL